MLTDKIDGARLLDGTGQTTIDSPVPTPIVFVPGVMGSRLKLGADAWDPDDAGNMMGWAARAPVDAAALLDIRDGDEATIMDEPIKWEGTLAEIWKLVDPAQKEDFYGKTRGWSGVSKDFYRGLLVSLEVYFNSPPFVPGAHPVYAFGYDWRKSNADCGKKLAKKIDDILAIHTDASKVVLVTHSMGGLVARHAVRAHANGGNAGDKVKGVVHVVQPVNGAVQAYRRFAEGVGPDRGGFFDLKAKVFASVLGGSFWGFTLLMSGTDGPLQLLPNQAYGGWLVGADGVPVPQGNIYDYYAGDGVESVIHDLDWKLARKLGYGRFGANEDTTREQLEQLIMVHGLPWDASDVAKTRAARVLDRWKDHCDKLRTGLTNARDFHEIVMSSAHPRTFMLYAGQHRTEVHYDWSKEEGERLGYEDHGGDGTVPVKSAMGLDKLIEHAWGTGLPGPIAPHRDVGAQEHSAVFEDQAVVEEVELLTFFLIRLEKPPEVVKQQCFLQTVDVECEHAATRGFKMRLPAPKGARLPINVLEIVAGSRSDADKVAVSGTFASARCAKHQSHVWKLVAPAISKTFKEEKATLELAYGDIIVEGSMARWLWPWNEKPFIYEVYANACHFPAGSFIVRVYPAVEPSISFQLQLSKKGSKQPASKTSSASTVGTLPETEWKIGFSAKVTYGKRVTELSAEMNSKLERLASMTSLVKTSVDRLSTCIFKYTGVSLSPVYPNLSLTYSGKFKEIEKTGRVGSEWSLTFKASPLLGLTLKIDALKAMINALKAFPPLSGLASGLDWLRTKAKEHDQTFDLTLSFTGTIGGEISGTKTAKSTALFKGGVTGKVQVQIAAQVSLGGKAAASVQHGGNTNDEDSLLGAEVGGEAKAGTGIFFKLEGAVDETGAYVSGKAGILGCRIELAAWASVKVFWEVKESYEKEFSLWGDIDLMKSDKHYLMRREQAE